MSHYIAVSKITGEPMSYHERLAKLSKNMENNSILVLKAPQKAVRNRDVHYPYRTGSDLLYLTGLNIEEFILVITSQMEVKVFMEMPDAQKERWEGKMFPAQTVAGQLGISHEDVSDLSEFWKQVRELLKNKEIVYFDYGNQPDFDRKFLAILTDLSKNNRARDLGPLKIYHHSNVVHEMRLFKTQAEIMKIQNAVDITTDAFSKIMNFTRKNRDLTEHSIRVQLESYMFQNGAKELAYPSIVAAGNNATVLHYTDCNDSVKPGDLVLIDAGCEWLGYASDITRTFPAGGFFNPEQKELYSLALSAQKASFTKCKPGNTLQDIHEATVDVITRGLWDLGLFREVPELDENGNIGDKGKTVKPVSPEEVIERKLYRHYYMHYTSHYLGLDVHDVGAYRIAGQEERKLESGMTFTVEPGIYIPESYDFVSEKYRGIGIRIEDDVFLEKTGCHILSANLPSSVEDIQNL